MPSSGETFTPFLIIQGNGVQLGDGFTGVMQFTDPLEWPVGSGSGVFLYYAVFKADVVQFYITSAGDVLAGAGAVVLDVNGIALLVGSGDVNSVKWYAENPFAYMGTINTIVTGTTPNRSAETNLISVAEGGSGTAVTYIIAFGPSSDPAIWVKDTPPYFNYRTKKLGDTGVLHYGNFSAAVSKANTTAAETIISRTIKANSLGTKGFMHTRVVIVFANGSGTGRTITPAYNFGAYAYSHGNQSLASGTNRMTLILEAWTWNDQAANAQFHVHSMQFGTGAALAQPNATPVVGFGTSAIDTTADVAMSFTATMSAAAASTVSFVAGAKQYGPYYA